MRSIEWTYLGDYNESIKSVEKPPKGTEALYVFKHRTSADHWRLIRVINRRAYMGEDEFKALYPGLPEENRLVLLYNIRGFDGSEYNPLKPRITEIRDHYGCTWTEAVCIAVHRNLIPATDRRDPDIRRVALGSVRNFSPDETKVMYADTFFKDLEVHGKPEKIYIATRVDRTKTVMRFTARSEKEAREMALNRDSSRQVYILSTEECEPITQVTLYRDGDEGVSNE